MRNRTFLALLVTTILGCGQSAVAPSPLVSTATLPPAPMAVASASPANPPAPLFVPMYPVASIYSLIDVQTTDGGLELRLGSDQGGGAIGRFRYVPFVNGGPDFARETSEVTHADTSGLGYVAIAGKRPHLVMHSVAGFRSDAGESYAALDENNAWAGHVDVGSAPGLGEGIFSWSKDRLLEFRSPDGRARLNISPSVRLPRLRVVQGTDKAAPSLPKALEKRLTGEGFSLTTFTALRSGEVLAVGRRLEAGGLGTLVWTDNLKEPTYFAANVAGMDEESDVTLLGGTSIASLRLQVADRILRLEGSSWVQESIVPKEGLPDVWFGSTLVIAKGTAAFARTAKGAAWLPIAEEPRREFLSSYVVDAEGTIWAIEDDVLVASRKPANVLEVTEAALVMGRKKSLLRGGSPDVTDKPPESFPNPACRMHYVLLDKSPAASAPQDFPEIRDELKGHTELANAKLIVSRERDWQFFGAQIQDGDTATKLAATLQKRFKNVAVLCAEPVAAREIKIDLKTGALLP